MAPESQEGTVIDCGECSGSCVTDGGDDCDACGGTGYATLEDEEAEFIAEAASRCICCTDCGVPFPCEGALAGDTCDAACKCDARFENPEEGFPWC